MKKIFSWFLSASLFILGISFLPNFGQFLLFGVIGTMINPSVKDYTDNL